MDKAMHNSISRRGFLGSAIHAGAALAGLAALNQVTTSGIEPFKRSGSSRLLLSLAAYSFREFLPETGRRSAAKADTRKRIDMLQFVDYCADQGCHGTEVTSYYFPENVTNEYLLKLKRHAFLRGIAISGTAVGNNFTLPKGPKRDQEIASVKRWVDRAAILGAPHIRVFAGGAEGASKAEAQKLCIAALEECCEYAGSKGVILGLENHGGIVGDAESVLEIIRAVQSQWLGINLDTGNFQTEDPYRDVARCAPYAVNVQYKVEMHPRGQPRQAADFGRVVKILREANYQGYVALEYEAAEDPWAAVPPILKRMRELL